MKKKKASKKSGKKLSGKDRAYAAVQMAVRDYLLGLGRKDGFTSEDVDNVFRALACNTLSLMNATLESSKDKNAAFGLVVKTLYFLIEETNRIAKTHGLSGNMAVIKVEKL